MFQKTVREIKSINRGFGRICGESGKAFPFWNLIKIPWVRLGRESLRGSKICVELVGVLKKKKKKLDKQMIAPPNRIQESKRGTQTLGDTNPEEKFWVLCQPILALAALQNVLVLVGPESSWEILDGQEQEKVVRVPGSPTAGLVAWLGTRASD